MSRSQKFKYLLVAAAALTSTSFNSNATVVEIRTSLGNIEVNLFDNTTPGTVDNFLSYVNSGTYASNVVHRLADGFVIQAGGFQYAGPIVPDAFSIDSVATAPPITNEPILSNVRGTIAMAKGSNPDSATSQWFINLSNNSNALDVAANAGGFTVFGQVIGDGMQVVDAIASLDIVDANAGGAFTTLPTQNYTQTDFDNNVVITDEHLVVISDIVVTDSSVDSAASLNPNVNTLINQSNDDTGSGGDSGGGSTSFLILLLLGITKISRSKK